MSRTACRSNAERLITFSTSAVAVCCCSASLEFGGARLHLLEQPHILDGDHRLVGEGFDQLDLTRGEGSDSLTQQDNRARDPAAMEERNTEHGADRGIVR